MKIQQTVNDRVIRINKRKLNDQEYYIVQQLMEGKAIIDVDVSVYKYEKEKYCNLMIVPKYNTKKRRCTSCHLDEFIRWR